MVPLPEFKMPEAETSLRLAFFLLQNRLANIVEVAIDGAQVKTLAQVHFQIGEFMVESQCEHCEPFNGGWSGNYRHVPSGGTLRIHSKPGLGDVTAVLADGRTFRAESKKGPLVSSQSSQEYPLLREALGQLLTISEVGETDVLAVAVPHSDKFTKLAEQWRKAPLIHRVGIKILTVERKNIVHGLDPSMDDLRE
jgi:hypothetical protein